MDSAPVITRSVIASRSGVELVKIEFGEDSWYYMVGQEAHRYFLPAWCKYLDETGWQDPLEREQWRGRSRGNCE